MSRCTRRKGTKMTAMQVQEDGAIPTADAAALSYRAFCEQFMARNRPVRIRNVVEAWFPHTRAWWHPGGINYEYLRRQYGQQDVPVVDGAAMAYGEQTRTTMTFAEYLDCMEQGRTGKLYLKDWHFVHNVQPDPPLYITPEYFEDDWLNWWWDREEKGGDDYRFVYIGPAGSWTPMHHDVFRSYSWSVNITGRKHWIFFHPDEEWKLKDRFGRTTIADVTRTDYDQELYPHVSQATAIHVIQEQGEAIFVPSGWYHQQEYAAVEQELEHLKEIGLTGREFEEQCQTVMLANTGMNYVEWQRLLMAKAQHLLTGHTLSYESNPENKWRGGVATNHLRKLFKIHMILQDLANYFGEGDNEVVQVDTWKELEGQLNNTI